MPLLLAGVFVARLQIVQAPRGASMGEGPPLALRLAGPALSVPNTLAIRETMGTAACVALIVAIATLSRIAYGRVFGWNGKNPCSI